MYATNSFFCLCCAPLHKLLSRSTDFSIRLNAGLWCLAHGYLGSTCGAAGGGQGLGRCGDEPGTGGGRRHRHSSPLGLRMEGNLQLQ